MLFRINRKPMLKTTSDTTSQSGKSVSPERDTALREMYERIAHGQALAEAEEQGRRKWQGR